MEQEEHRDALHEQEMAERRDLHRKLGEARKKLLKALNGGAANLLNITSNPENTKKELAARCEKGDTAAMMELANCFLRKTSGTCRKLAKAYGIGEANRKKFLCYLGEHQDERRDVLAGNMWVTRAALYGHPEAKRLFAENPVYEECILMPIEMFLEGKGLNYSLDSETLRYAGLFGFPEHTVVSISSLENGVFMATTDAGTEGPDETGFGMEELYDFYQYDEFFHLLHSLKGWSNRDLRVQTVSPFAGKLEAAENERKRYWTLHKGRDGAIPYVEQSIAAKDFIVRSGILTKCMKSDLRHAEIPYGVTKIADRAFFSAGQLESVNIPETVTEIGRSAFQNCRALKSVYLPDSVRVIGENVFDGCRNLASVRLPDGLVLIPARAFQACHNLKDLQIPDTVTELGNECFSWFGAEQVRMPKNLNRLGDRVFEYSDLTEIEFPAGVNVMGTKNFRGCRKLKQVKLPDLLKVLPAGTFSYCDSVEEIFLPSDLVAIQRDCFDNCKSLRHVTFRGNAREGVEMFPNTLKEIGSNAFKDCESLPSMHIPAHVKKIDSSAFRGCRLPKGIEVNRENPFYYAAGGMLFDKKTPTLICAPQKKQLITLIPNGTKKIGEGAFAYNDEVRSVLLPESVVEIGNSAFSFAKNLESVEFENGVRTLGVQVFRYCHSLKRIDLLQSLTEIGKGCFESCDSLEHITIPPGVSVLKAGLFAHCTSLREIYISDGVEEIGDIFGFNKNELWGVLKSIRIPGSVITIEKGLFWNHYDIWKDLTIIGKKGSQAEQLAKAEGIAFLCEQERKA